MSERDPKPVVVQKYGGSSVADIDRLKLVAERVVATARAGHRVVVVVSAMGQTTDELIGLARSASSEAGPSRREMDMLVSAGERIASALLAMAIESLGLAAISFTGSQCGIITSHRHTDARILEVRPYRVIDELDEGRVVVIAGYQGVSYKREITTLGRGGSDTTAVAMAAALGAIHCEICSDVDGVYDGDPRVVSGARHLESLSYDEMTELSQHGAKVLNAEAVAQARRAGIAIYARASSGDGHVTRISAEGSGRAVVGVTGVRDLSLLRGDGGVAQLAALGEVLRDAEVAPLSARLDGVGASGGAPTLLLVRERCHDYSGLLDKLRRAAGGALDVREGLDAATVVGEGLTDDPNALTEALAVAERASLPLIDLYAGARRLTLLLEGGRLDDAVRALHDAFV